jgi:hypothetical protein
MRMTADLVLELVCVLYIPRVQPPPVRRSSLVGRSLISRVHEHENDPLICQLVDSSEEFSSSSVLHKNRDV